MVSRSKHLLIPLNIFYILTSLVTSKEVNVASDAITQNHRQTIKQKEGTDLSLSCGKQKLTEREWYLTLNGQRSMLLTIHQDGALQWGTVFNSTYFTADPDNGTLKLENAQEHWSGIYECLVDQEHYIYIVTFEAEKDPETKHQLLTLVVFGIVTSSAVIISAVLRTRLCSEEQESSEKPQPEETTAPKRKRTMRRLASDSRTGGVTWAKDGQGSPTGDKAMPPRRKSVRLSTTTKPSNQPSSIQPSSIPNKTNKTRKQSVKSIGRGASRRLSTVSRRQRTGSITSASKVITDFSKVLDKDQARRQRAGSPFSIYKPAESELDSEETLATKTLG